ncbi:MAG: hypothetical protein EA397_20035 [Deltaproteobacteria bacterium]|nr:MAG: hypothetical protein EA397_20035 [Deltaproteobacteria bacterium]
MSTDRVRLVAAAGAVLLLGAAALIPAPPIHDQGSFPPGYATSGATLAWLSTVHRYTHGPAAPSTARADQLYAELQVLRARDPRFVEQASASTAMLRVLEGGDGPHTRAWARHWPGHAALLLEGAP